MKKQKKSVASVADAFKRRNIKAFGATLCKNQSVVLAKKVLLNY